MAFEVGSGVSPWVCVCLGLAERGPELADGVAQRARRPCPQELQKPGERAPPRALRARPAREQNATQTILPLVREGYAFSVSHLMVLSYPVLFLLSVFICQTEGPE